MRILPVIDLMNGVVVRAVAGRRHEYRPLVSRLTQSVQPLDVAQAFRDRFGLSEFYLADLDAIAGNPPCTQLLAQLLARGFILRVDAGIGPFQSQVRTLADVGVQHIVAGLESLSGPDELATLITAYGPARIVFSLDLRDGRLLAKDGWMTPDPFELACKTIALGARKLLVLDLAAVGTGQGTPAALCERIRSAHPEIELATGGGVGSAQDLERLRHIGVDLVLVASALHDGCFDSVQTDGTF